jgi:copper homeostasis protein CutC
MVRVYLVFLAINFFRAGDFCYTDVEFEVMRSDVQMCAELKGTVSVLSLGLGLILDLELDLDSDFVLASDLDLDLDLDFVLVVFGLQDCFYFV